METWLHENDILQDDCNPENYQPTESKPKTSCQDHGGVAFYVREGIECQVFRFHSGIECLITGANFGKNRSWNFCVMYRPHSQKISHFLQAFENLLEILRNLKNDTILCGDFIIDTFKISEDNFDDEKLLLALDFKKKTKFWNNQSNTNIRNLPWSNLNELSSFYWNHQNKHQWSLYSFSNNFWCYHKGISM